MKAEEARGLADDELKARISELEEERFRLNFRAGTEALEEPLRLRSVRRDIARLHTIARERALGIVRTTEKKAPAAKKGAAKKGAAKKATAKKGTAKKAAAKKATKASGR
jgi:large subunit ribosomal protein L29